MREIHGDYERLLTAKYNELKLMIPTLEPGREAKLSSVQNEVTKINNWIKVTTPTIQTITQRIDQCEDDLS